MRRWLPFGGPEESATPAESATPLAVPVDPLLPPPSAPSPATGYMAGARESAAGREVTRLVSNALDARASDIHLEHHAEGLRVRYRVDGILHDVDPPEVDLSAAVLARVRVMAGLNLTEQRIPQDGRIRMLLDDRTVDVRISTVPMLGGESVVLRLLDGDGRRIRLGALGLREDDHAKLVEILTHPDGMMLATGPGGAGKSTTLHAIVQHISSGREKILTVEDPVEYDIPGLCQVPVNHRAGLTFANVLRSLVRQDPNVLLVGEIRDGETADIATHAALTGHLVLSTLHTTDAVSALARLLDLGVPDYLVAHTLRAVLAQRLVRRVCDGCAEETPVSADAVANLGPDAEGLERAMVGGGCDACHGTGYRDRIGLYEVLAVDDPLRDAFMARATVKQLRDVAMESGMRTLRADGIGKIREGVTTPKEVLRVT